MNEKNSPFKDLVISVFEDSLKNSKYISVLVANVATIAKQTTKITDMVLQIYERLEEHERALLLLAEHKKASTLDYVKPHEKSSKPN